MRDHYRSKQNFLVSETIGPGGGVPVAYALVFVLFDYLLFFPNPFTYRYSFLWREILECLHAALHLSP
jgi:hypothetical protein